MNTGKQIIAIIVAHDANRAIGLNGEMPWRLSADLKRFKSITMGHPVIMGRKTFESIPGGALPGRKNIVVTKNSNLSSDNIYIAKSPQEALTLCSDSPKVFIIGGGNLYRQFIDHADMLYITLIHHAFEADTWFPEYDPALFEIIEEEYIENDPKFPHPYSFITFNRINK